MVIEHTTRGNRNWNLHLGSTARTHEMIQQNKVEAQTFLHANICLSHIWCCLFFIRKQNANRCHKCLLKNLEKAILLSVTMINWSFVARTFIFFIPLLKISRGVHTSWSFHIDVSHLFLFYLECLYPFHGLNSGFVSFFYTISVFYITLHFVPLPCLNLLYVSNLYYPCCRSQGGFSSCRKAMCSCCIEDMKSVWIQMRLTSMGTS